jgi:hypothetical protein
MCPTFFITLGLGTDVLINKNYLKIFFPCASKVDASEFEEIL